MLVFDAIGQFFAPFPSMPLSERLNCEKTTLSSSSVVYALKKKQQTKMSEKMLNKFPTLFIQILFFWVVYKARNN
jgi:hypothetical protein